MPLSGRETKEPPAESAKPVPADDSDRVLESILGSESFSKAYVLRQLLRYLWEHRNETLDEYSIAIHALSRKPDFDPKTDSAVRVTMARLRVKLKEFYDGEGSEYPLWLWIPRNGYDLEYRLTKAGIPTKEPPPSPAALAPSTNSRWRVMALAAICLVAGALLSWILAPRPVAIAPQAVAVEAPAFWKTFFAGENRALLVLPDVTFIQWKNRTLTVADSSVDAFSSWKLSPLLKEFAGRYGKPAGWANYLGVQDALAALQLAQYLGRFGAQVKVVPTRDLTVDSFVGTNVILLGLPESSYQLKSKMRRLDFQTVPGGNLVRNLKPRPGEPASFEESHQTADRVLSHGVFAVLPGRTPTTRSLLLCAANPLSVLPLLVSTGPLNNLGNDWRAAASPTYYQGVVETVTEAGSVLRIRVVALRPYLGN